MCLDNVTLFGHLFSLGKIYIYIYIYKEKKKAKENTYSSK